MTKLNTKEVASRYARAIFKLVDDQGQLNETYQELMAVRTIFSENPTLGPWLAKGSTEIKLKQKIVDEVKKNLSVYVANLVQMVFDYGRMNSIVAIIDEFERQYDIKYKRVHVSVMTAICLDDVQRQQLKAGLASRLGANEIVLEEEVNPAILGGVIIKTPNEIFDGSLATKIRRIRDLIIN